jgi:3-deoxy-manno-octulosonate cytidylyltransferase (CMP-KDO synthetase)
MTKRLANRQDADSTLSFNVLIPARYGSLRLPGKPLLDIAGKPMVVRVAERAALSGAKKVMVATEDARIMQAVKEHGFDACMTQADHVSGTDRIAEAAMQQGWSDDTVVVNVQGDEPLISPALIAEVASLLNKDSSASMATACYAISNEVDFLNPNVVKLVLDDRGHAMYFSRAPIPYLRDAVLDAVGGVTQKRAGAYRHVGLYAYRVKFLKCFSSMPVAALEQIEGLEQLRAMQQGFRIAVHVTDQAPISSVDTEEDLQAVRFHTEAVLG